MNDLTNYGYHKPKQQKVQYTNEYIDALKLGNRLQVHTV